eukprot:6895388-Prorocentrum_lima.AAC.1
MATPGHGEVLGLLTAIEHMEDYGIVHSDYLVAVHQIQYQRCAKDKLMYGHLYQQILLHPHF